METHSNITVQTNLGNITNTGLINLIMGIGTQISSKVLSEGQSQAMDSVLSQTTGSKYKMVKL